MEWCRGVAVCARAHAQERLNNLLVAAEYIDCFSSPSPRIVQMRF
jgi:hypothetical protein